jgi:peptide/nickel transport system ATP-binding protein/oligopeptide transport system ATP-binding protein
MLGLHKPLAAVKDVSLRVERGAVLGLVGESGCGKSTLAQIIMRLEPETSGRVRFDGTDITDLTGRTLQPFRRRLQMVFQDSTASLNPRKTVSRVLGESLALADVPSEERKRASAEQLEQVGLDRSFASRYPHQLSGGQRQRVAIARALAMRPELLVADEPVSSLDVSLQAQILRLLIELRKKLGLTMIFISHDLALVHHLCSEVAVMQDGGIVERGIPADVLRAPQHEYTRKLLAAVPKGPALRATA